MNEKTDDAYVAGYLDGYDEAIRDMQAALRMFSAADIAHIMVYMNAKRVVRARGKGQ